MYKRRRQIQQTITCCILAELTKLSVFLIENNLLTGSSSGIGAATALHFAKNGAKLALVARNLAKVRIFWEGQQKFQNFNHFEFQRIITPA